ncbi:glycosyltransferase [Asticcacaulis sp. DW145]|uniref:glycosyltransferase n=1 Tax=Asticcacaulis sp. DW145 TaxID=3095608 RepID=UPI0030878F37|nr:glycosyltransferase [Asticcacaulis sp. DW145]
MKILFASGRGYFPEVSGGVQSSTDALARRLTARGHTASVLAALYGEGLFGFAARIKLKLGGSGYVRDQQLGYPVFRSWSPVSAIPQLCKQFKPDVALVQCGGSVPVAKALMSQNVPVVVYLRNVEFHELEGDITELKGSDFISNSHFTAFVYKSRFGIDSTVIPPTIDPENYCTDTLGEFVTFINPVEKKGLSVALGVAKLCPDIPFLFVESWRLNKEEETSLLAQLNALPNVKFRRRTMDMKGIYRQTRVLLAPSLWEEAWGRVASEAQCSGIPVLASNRGGLPEAVGSGGVVLSPDAPLELWASTLRRLWADEAYYSDLSKLAAAHASREELDPDKQFEAFLNVLTHATKNHSS